MNRNRLHPFVPLFAFLALSGCYAPGPQPAEYRLNSPVLTDENSAIVIGAQIDSHRHAITFVNRETGESPWYVAPEDMFIRLGAGTWEVAHLGSRQGFWAAVDKPFTFSVSAGEIVYIGSFLFCEELADDPSRAPLLHHAHVYGIMKAITRKMTDRHAELCVLNEASRVIEAFRQRYPDYADRDVRVSIAN